MKKMLLIIVIVFIGASLVSCDKNEMFYDEELPKYEVYLEVSDMVIKVGEHKSVDYTLILDTNGEKLTEELIKKYTEEWEKYLSDGKISCIFIPSGTIAVLSEEIITIQGTKISGFNKGEVEVDIRISKNFKNQPKDLKLKYGVSLSEKFKVTVV